MAVAAVSGAAAAAAAKTKMIKRRTDAKKSIKSKHQGAIHSLNGIVNAITREKEDESNISPPFEEIHKI